MSRIMKTREIIVAVSIIAVVAILMVLAPKSDNMSSLMGGGGVNLKDLNEKDTTEVSIGITLQANQTTRQNLEQGLVIGNYYKRTNGIYIGASVMGGVSTQYGVCCPTMYINTGLDFNSFQLEYKVGNFKRSTLLSGGVDPQYGNYCLDLGEGASASNAMQISFIKGQTRLGFGHQGGEDFFKFDSGNWYAFAEVPVCNWLTIGGGMNFGCDATGHAAAKASCGDNKIVLTGNQLGTETQNVVVTYNRENLSLFGNKLMIAVSGWAKKASQGLHLNAGFTKNWGTLYAEAGTNFSGSQVTPYIGVGTSIDF